MADNPSSHQNRDKWRHLCFKIQQDQARPDNFEQHNWLEDVDAWWKTQPGTVAESVDSLYRKLFFSSRFFTGFAEPFEASKDKDDAATVLVNYLQIYLESMQLNKDIITETNEIFKGFWALPFDVWQQQMSFLKGFPESFFDFAEHELENDHGNTELSSAYQRYLQALQNYQSAYLSMSMDAATVLMQQLQNQNSKHFSPEKICTTWIELFEKHYADFVTKDEYSHLFAEIINSWMLLIQQTKRFITPWLIAMNMPNKNDIDALKARQKELLEENFFLKKQLTTSAYKD